MRGGSEATPMWSRMCRTSAIVSAWSPHPRLSGPPRQKARTVAGSGFTFLEVTNSYFFAGGISVRLPSAISSTVPVLSLSGGGGGRFCRYQRRRRRRPSERSHHSGHVACVCADHTGARRRALAVGLRTAGIVPGVNWDLHGLVWPLEIICCCLLSIWH